MQAQTADSVAPNTSSEMAADVASTDAEMTAQSADGSTSAEAASSDEVEAVIAELEAYRQRLVDETMDIARKIKLPKKAAQAQVDRHPEIAKISQMIQGLRDRQRAPK